VPAFPRLLLCIALAGLPALAEGAPRSISDCEKIEAADAYNRCLALFGPPGRSLRLGPTEKLGGDGAEAATVDAEPAVPKGNKARHARRAGRYASAPRNEIRAKRMVFTVLSDQTRER
jgi:hypothetical protein